METTDTRWTPSTRKGGTLYTRTCNGKELRVYWTQASMWMAWVGNTHIGYFYQSTAAKRAATKAAKEANHG